MRASCGGHAANAKRAGVDGVDGTRALAEDVVKSNHRRRGRVGVAWGVDCPGPPWHWVQARSNTALPCCSSGVSRRIGIRQRHRAFADGVGQGANTMVREQHPLKRRQIVEQLLRRRALDLRVIGERAERLLLKRRDAGVQLVAAGLVRAARPRDAIVRAGEGDIVDRRHAPPHVHERLGRRHVGRRIDEPDVRWQREGDPDEAVLAKIAEIAGALAVDPEIIRVDRPEQRIVGIGIAPPPPLEELEPRLDAGGRELEIVRRHVAVGARAPVRAQSSSLRSKNARRPRSDGVAGLAAAVVRLAARLRARRDHSVPGVPPRRCWLSSAASRTTRDSRRPAMMMSSQAPSDL